MGLKLVGHTDPRDRLDKARRKDLENYLRVHHSDLYEHNMPAIVMRQMLRSRGVKDVAVSVRETVEEEIPEVNADDLLMAEWKAKQKTTSMVELRKAVKARGITAPRTSKRADLEAMLNGQDPS